MLLCGTGPCFGVLLHRHAPLQSSTCAPSIAPRLTPLRQKVLCASSTGWKPLKRVFQKPTGVSHTPAGEDKQDKPGIGNAPGGEVAEHGPSNNDSAKSTSRQETSESDQWNSISRAIVDQFGNTWASDEDYRLSSDGVWIPSSNGSPSDPSTSWALGSSKDNPADFESQWKACSAADENSGEDWTLGGGEASPPLGSDVGWTPGKANQGWTPGSLSSKASRKDFNATSGRTSNGTARQTVPSQHTPSGQVTERRFSKDDSDTFGSRRKPNSGDCEAIPGGNKAPSTEGSPRGAVVGWTPSNKANQGWMPSSLNSRAGQKESLATFRSTPTGAAHQAVPSQRSPTSQGTERGSSTNGSPSDSRDNPDISGSQWKPSSGKGDHNPGDRRNPSGQPSPSSPGIGWTPTSKATKEPSDGQRAPSRPTSKDSQNHPSANSRWAPSGTAHQTAPSQWTPDSQGTARNPNGGWPPSGEPATQHGPVAGWIPGRKVNADSPALSRSGWHRGHDADNQSRLEESINQLRAHVEVSAADWADWDDTPKVSTVIAEVQHRGCPMVGWSLDMRTRLSLQPQGKHKAFTKSFYTALIVLGSGCITSIGVVLGPTMLFALCRSRTVCSGVLTRCFLKQLRHADIVVCAK